MGEQTPNLGLYLPTPGSEDAWGSLINQNFEQIDQLLQVPGTSLFRIGDNIVLAANAVYAAGVWNRIDTTRPAMAIALSVVDVQIKILLAGAGENPITWIERALDRDYQPIGVKWDRSSSSPSLQHIDMWGNEISPLKFDNHALWGNVRRCTIDSAGTVTYGINARGDGLTLDGSQGNVMVRIPATWVKIWKPSVDELCIVHSPIPIPGSRLDPTFYQRGGIAQDEWFFGAYEASGALDGDTFKFASRTGVRPVTGDSAYPSLPNSGRLNIADAEQYANNIGEGWGITNVWANDLLWRYFIIEYATFDSQSALGKGIVDLQDGSGFAGKNTGSDDIDTRLAPNGTGIGSGTDGQTPITYRGIENPWGNVWKFIAGINAYTSPREWRVVPRTGLSSAAIPTSLTGTAGTDYHATAGGPPAADAYISNLLYEDEVAELLLPSEVAGSSSQYLCDHYWYPRSNPGILLAGGAWTYGLTAGAGARYAYYALSLSSRYLGARLEFRKNPTP